MKKKFFFVLGITTLLLVFGLGLSGCETYDDFAYGYAYGRGWLSYDGAPITPIDN